SSSLQGLDRAERLKDEWSEGRILLGRSEASSGEDGTFRVTSLEPTPHHVTATKRGFLPEKAFQVARGTRALPWTRSTGGSVSGRVRRPDGGLGKGGLVSARREGIREVHKIFDGRQGGELSFLEGDPPRAGTLEDGRFRIEGIPEG